MKQLKITQQITNRETQSLNKYFVDVNAIPMITSEEEVELAKKAKNGDKKAIDKLVTSNLRFVVSVAKQYQSAGDLLDDLISAGNIGLIEAAKRFDDTKGFKFISYAVWWIRQSIIQHISENGKTIRVPSNKILLNNKLRNIVSELEQTLERNPSALEVCDLYTERYNSEIDEKTVNDILLFGNNISSMDAKISNDEDSTTMSDLIQGEGFENIENEVFKKDLTDTIVRISKNLSKNERYVLLSYYGINCKEKSLSEIGEDLELTRERVRQIKDKAVRRMKTYSSRKLLKQYI